VKNTIQHLETAIKANPTREEAEREMKKVEELLYQENQEVEAKLNQLKLDKEKADQEVLLLTDATTAAS